MRDLGTIIIADDDAKVRKPLAHYLVKEGFRVVQAASGKELRSLLDEETVDLVLLDLDLGDEDGLVISKELSDRTSLGVIIITGKGDVVDRVIGLEMGADDYLPKPFHLREVLARIKSVLRRLKPRRDGSAQNQSESEDAAVVVFGKWTLNFSTRQLTDSENKEVGLTSAEFALLSALARNPNRTMTRDQLLDHTAGRDWNPNDRSIDTLISRLRKKIESDPGKPNYIKSIRGVGYVLAAQVKRS
ncbi:MAG: winged helix-turn-helix domain-containing protein [Rhodospirillaceae bacterium]